MSRALTERVAAGKEEIPRCPGALSCGLHKRGRLTFQRKEDILENEEKTLIYRNYLLF